MTTMHIPSHPPLLLRYVFPLHGLVFNKHVVGLSPMSLLPVAQDWQNAGFWAIVQLAQVASHTVTTEVH